MYFRICQQLLHTVRLAGTGYLLLLPVDQGIEHSTGECFAPNPLYFDPENIVKLAIEGGCNGVATALGVLGSVAREYAHQIPFILKFNHNEMPALIAVGATVYFGSSIAHHQDFFATSPANSESETIVALAHKNNDIRLASLAPELPDVVIGVEARNVGGELIRGRATGGMEVYADLIKHAAVYRQMSPRVKTSCCGRHNYVRSISGPLSFSFAWRTTSGVSWKVVSETRNGASCPLAATIVGKMGFRKHLLAIVAIRAKTRRATGWRSTGVFLTNCSEIGYQDCTSLRRSIWSARSNGQAIWRGPHSNRICICGTALRRNERTKLCPLQGSRGPLGNGVDTRRKWS